MKLLRELERELFKAKEQRDEHLFDEIEIKILENIVDTYGEVEGIFINKDMMKKNIKGLPRIYNYWKIYIDELFKNKIWFMVDKYPFDDYVNRFKKDNKGYKNLFQYIQGESFLEHTRFLRRIDKETLATLDGHNEYILIMDESKETIKKYEHKNK